MEVGKLPPPSGGERPQQAEPLQYPSIPYPAHVVAMISNLPLGMQRLAYQERAISLQLIAAWIRGIRWGAQLFSLNVAVASASDSLQSSRDLNLVLSELWGVIERLDPQTAPLERYSAITIYLQILSFYFRQLLQSSSIFQALRLETTNFAYHYQPQTGVEFESFVFCSMFAIQAWK